MAVFADFCRCAIRHDETTPQTVELAWPNCVEADATAPRIDFARSVRARAPHARHAAVHREHV